MNYLWPVFLLVSPRFVKMYTSRKKIHKDKDAEPTEFEETVAQVSIFVCFEITILIHWKVKEHMMPSSICRQYLIWKILTKSLRVIWKTFTLILHCKGLLLASMLNLWIIWAICAWCNDKLFSLCSQIDVAANRKAVVIHVPYRLRKAFRKIHVRLVRELEKKFSGKVRFGICNLISTYVYFCRKFVTWEVHFLILTIACTTYFVCSFPVVVP